ncbi:MAG TPA: hypothetical protein VM370_09065 [Candidatus Thermoplasmatota archaeon]|nr:hypothetical protein [Candidatus Thermoplasmatota archaeon]
MRTNLQRIAAAWCLLMAGLLIFVQVAPLPHMPFALFALFNAVWIFGAAMLWWFPTFGAIGTALYGLILAVSIVRMHGGSALNWAIAAGSLIGSGLAIAFLMRRHYKPE